MYKTVLYSIRGERDTHTERERGITFANIDPISS